jgi:hypothetical protein
MKYSYLEMAALLFVFSPHTYLHKPCVSVKSTEALKITKKIGLSPQQQHLNEEKVIE